MTFPLPWQPDPRIPPERLDRQFAEWRLKHPNAWAEMIKVCVRARDRGYKRWSINAAFEILRWERYIPGLPSEDEVWKLNNNLRSRASRALMAENPDFEGMFETRELRG